MKSQTESQSTELTSISYPIAPRKNPDYRSSNMLVTLTTNLFQLEISPDDIPAAADAEKTGSVSV